MGPVAGQAVAAGVLAGVVTVNIRRTARARAMPRMDDIWRRTGVPLDPVVGHRSFPAVRADVRSTQLLWREAVLFDPLQQIVAVAAPAGLPAPQWRGATE